MWKKENLSRELPWYKEELKITLQSFIFSLKGRKFFSSIVSIVSSIFLNANLLSADITLHKKRSKTWEELQLIIIGLSSSLSYFGFLNMSVQKDEDKIT